MKVLLILLTLAAPLVSFSQSCITNSCNKASINDHAYQNQDLFEIDMELNTKLNKVLEEFGEKKEERKYNLNYCLNLVVKEYRRLQNKINNVCIKAKYTTQGGEKTSVVIENI